MNRKMVLILPLFLLTQATLAMDPPGIAWVRTYFEGYYSNFTEVRETEDGGFIATVATAVVPQFALCRFNSVGDTLWTAISGRYNQTCYWVEELSNGDFIVTGQSKETSGSSLGLLLALCDSEGNEIWNHLYDLPESAEIGYCVIPVPDGGFVACGGINVTTGLDHAWILRTDANGDTLWARQWGGYTLNEATRVIYLDGLLHVLTYGRIDPDSAKGVHLVTWDLEGNLLDEVRIPELTGQGMDMCYCPWDGGYTIVTKSTMYTEIAHVDDQGSLLWRVATSSDGYSISTTMDGDYIYGGQKITPTPGFLPVDQPGGSDTEWRGRVVLFGPEGEQLWEDWIYEFGCMAIYSIRQLSEGGYIAVGQSLDAEFHQNGLMIRYEPETGIQENVAPQISNSLAVPVPNPSTGGFSISFSLTTDGPANLAVFDLAGRLVTELYEGTDTTGEHSLSWDTGDLPSGCYIVMLRTEEGVQSRNCVLIR
jgi:hypothetical protein